MTLFESRIPLWVGLASLAICATAGAEEPLAAPSPSDIPEEMVLFVNAQKKNPVSLDEPSSHTEVSHDLIKSLPLGDQASLQQLYAETVPGAVMGAQDRIFFRQNEFGIRYEIDGILLPDLPSESLGQPFDLRNVDHLDVLTGALPAQYGERLFSLVQIGTLKGTEKPRLDVELSYGSYNTVSPQASVGGSSSDGRFRYFASANYRSTDRGQGTPQPISETDQTQGGQDAIHDQAHSNSEFVKLDWVPSSSDRFSLIVSNSDSFYQIPNYPSSFLPTDPFFQPGFTDQFGNGAFNYVPSNTDDSQSEVNAFMEAVWRHDLSETSHFQLGIYTSYYQVNVTNDPTHDLAAFTLIPGSSPSSFAESRHLNGVGLQGDYVQGIGASHRLGAGFKLSGSQSSGILQITGQNQTTSQLATYTDTGTDRSWMEGVYLQDDFTISSQWLLNVGLRYDVLQISFPDAQPTYSEWEPRVGLSYLPFEGTKFHAFSGRLFLPPWLENLREAFSYFQIGTSGAPYDIVPEQASYFEAGVEQAIGHDHVVKLTAYYKNSVNLLDDAQLFNTSLSQPLNWSHGYALGLDLSMSGRIFPWLAEFLNYGFGTARGEGLGGGLFATAPNAIPVQGAYQALDHVQRHTLAAGLVFNHRTFWASTEGLFGSGLPTGPDNSVTLPSHLTFNLSAGTMFFSESTWTSFRLSGDVTNLFDNVYPISVANGFNGSYYAAGRGFMLHLEKEI